MKTKMGMRKARSMACEFVTGGHPDKVCDQMADAIVDAAMAGDPDSRVAMEVTGGHGSVVVIGEMTTKTRFDIGEVVRKTYADIGHNHLIGVFVNVVVQSPDIAKGVNETEGKEQGAGDQGIMVGYAVNDGPNFMPKIWTISRMLCTRTGELWQQKILPYLRPDGKSQVTMVGDRVTHVTLAAHYSEDETLAYLCKAHSDDGTLAQIRKALDRLGQERLDQIREEHLDPTGQALLREIRDALLAHVRKDLFTHVIRHVVPDLGQDYDALLNLKVIVVNGTGRFVQGGFDADAGTTGRKLMVDSYGPNIEVGGGCYSGKDPSKVDRSAVYFCRMIAKSIIAGGHANEAIVKVAFAIGQEKPTLISVETDLPEEQAVKLEQKVRDMFDFRPRAIIERLGLLKPEGWCYRDTAAAGHFGDKRFPWEQVVPI